MKTLPLIVILPLVLFPAGSSGADFDSSVKLIDFHVHLRGGMTADKAIGLQEASGIRRGVLRNIGQGWPVETNEQLADFLDSVEGKPLFVGVQVNDRDWYTKFDKALLERLDYVLADTMIMPDENGTPIRLWMDDQVHIDDAEAWMARYMEHNLRVLAEPIDILANPTYLPNCLAGNYDELWTDARMRQIIAAGIKNHVAFEINAQTGYASERFVRLAKEMGAKFTIGSNNMDDRLIDMSRCRKLVEKCGLSQEDMFVPRSFGPAQRSRKAD